MAEITHVLKKMQKSDSSPLYRYCDLCESKSSKYLKIYIFSCQSTNNRVTKSTLTEVSSNESSPTEAYRIEMPRLCIVL